MQSLREFPYRRAQGGIGAGPAAADQRVVHDLRRQAASHLLSAGALWADSPRQLAADAEVIFSSLPEPSDVAAVALGPDGLVTGDFSARPPIASGFPRGNAR